MTIEEILAGESRNIEFKESLPDKSIKYMKSVVAFANGTGGKIVFGVEDHTHKVVGVGETDVFKMMDAIANAISDHCEPAIIPDITLQTLDGKTLVIVEVSEGRQRPYYIKTLGRDKGVYIRIGGTTRLADEYMVRELLFEGSSRCFDQTIYTGLEITDSEIDILCRSMKEEAVKNAQSEVQKAAVKDVGRKQLCSWGILIEKDGRFYPTNSYVILAGCDVWPVATQCGVFKGTTREIFIDRREYKGPIWKQIEQAYQFVLRNIHMGAVFEGIYRQDVYEIPPDAIRELIVNAAVHRSYLDHGNIQVAVYDDRLEITSPGKLPMGQTIARMKEGYSKIRNEALAYAFSYMNLIEHWGSGIPRIISKVKSAGLPEPEFIGGDVDLRINIYRKENGVKNGIDGVKNGVDGVKNVTKNISDTRETIQERSLLEIIAVNPEATQTYYAEQTGASKRTVSRLFASLQEKGMLKREGSKRKGKWIIINRN